MNSRTSNPKHGRGDATGPVVGPVRCSWRGRGLANLPTTLPPVNTPATHGRGDATGPGLCLLLAVVALLLAGCREAAAPTATLPVSEVHTWVVPTDEARQPAPRSAAVGGNGEVVVLDTAGRALVYTPAGTCVRQWSMPEVSAGRPEGLVVLRDGHVVVCDTHYHRVLEFDAAGTVVRQFGQDGKGPGEFVYPVAVAVDTAENLFIAEYGGNDRIQVFTRSGQFVRAFGSFGTGPGAFQRPSGLAWREGRVYVADAFNNRVQVFTDQGQFLQVLETPALHFPYDLKLGADGSLYVIEYGAGRLTKLGLDGKLLGRYGSSGPGNGQFATPWGLAVLGASRVLVADTGNRRLVELVME